MNALTTFDRESFQKLLADAFAVQESGMDAHSLYTVVQVQRSIDAAPFDADRTMNLIADGARDIAHADGIAIAGLEANQLAYRVGAGSATSYASRRLAAVFTVSAHHDPRREILRVENAQTDKRIEASICTQFGVRSLLILPVYHAHELTGILQVFFTQEHTFQDREVYAYRLMAGLAGEVMARDLQDSRKAMGAYDRVPTAVYPSTSKSRTIVVPSQYEQPPATNVWSHTVCKAVRSVATQSEPPCPIVKAVATITQPLKRVHNETREWRIAVAVSALIFIAAWIAHDYTVRELTLRQTNPTSESSLTSYQPASEPHSSKRQAEAVATTEHKSQHSRYKRTPVRPDSAGYIASDVITRHFTTPTLDLQVRTPNKEVGIGEDVTVRSFTYKPAMASAKTRTPGSVR